MDNGALTLLGYSLRGLTGRDDHEALSVVAQYAKAYTKGAGFDENGNPNDDVAAVILTATARLLANPGQLAVKAIGGLSLTFRADQAGPWGAAGAEPLPGRGRRPDRPDGPGVTAASKALVPGFSPSSGPFPHCPQ